MTRLASRFGAANLIRRDRPLTREELFRVVPSVFSEDKHASRSARYTWIPTITVLENLQHEGFQPFFECVTQGVVSIQSTCCACVGRDKLPANKCRKSFCSILTMAPVRIRCYRDYSVRYARTGLSAVSRLARCGCRTKEMS